MTSRRNGLPDAGLTVGARVSTQLIYPCTHYELTSEEGPRTSGTNRRAYPIPGIGDVLVQVHAASFTPTEMDWPSTWVDRAGKDRRPVIPAHEVSGVVTALGYGTTGAAIGDAVYGLTDWYRDGAAAEYVAVEARNLAPKPATLSHHEAAAIPMAGLTAVQALFDHGRLAAGQTVLVLGAGGGVGTFAVQLARAAGARVLASARGVGARARARARRGRIRRCRSRRRRRIREGRAPGVRPRRWSDVRARLVVPEGRRRGRVRSSRRPPPGPMVVGRAGCSSSSSPTGRSSPSSAGASPRASYARSSVRSCRSPQGGAAFAAKQRGSSPGKIVLQVANDPL